MYRLKLEYEGNDYSQEFAGKIEQKSKFNVGAIYRVTDWADVNLSYERGNTVMFGFTLRTNSLLLNLSGELLRVVVTFILQLQAQRLPRRLILHAAKQGSRCA